MVRPQAILLLFLLALPGLAQDDPAPTEQQREAILANIGSFVEKYLNTLPNLICMKTTEQYKGNRKGEHWRQLDSLTARLTLVNGQEKTVLVRVNNKPVETAHTSRRRPLTSEGEFGAMLGVVLSEKSDAKIAWKKWDTLNGHRVAVFDYAIDKEHSTLRLSLSDLAEAVLPYTGSLYADPESGTVWRVTDTVTEIPKELQTVEMSTVLDYGEVPIGGKKFILPIHATVVDYNRNDTNRNEITFSDYRKFEAESTINFGDGSAPQQ